MNSNLQKSLEVIKDKLQQGIINAEEANIQFVEAERFRIITRSLNRDFRKALNSGVKQGRLIRVKETESNPEYYYKPNFEYMAKQEIYSRQCTTNLALKSICM